MDRTRKAKGKNSEAEQADLVPGAEKQNQGGGEGAPNPQAGNFYDEVKQRMKARRDRNVLVSIPIWGWTGDGKTCALLTAVHFADASQHALAFSLVTDSHELREVEANTDAYKGLNLAEVAASTVSRFAALNETFIDGTDWPPGTDEPTPYLLAVHNVGSTVGYVFFPDLKGGSFREVDDVARTVLARAHACIILVEPENYVEKSATGKRYRDEVRRRFERCANANVPACLVITKSDQFDGETNTAADETHNQLTVLVGSRDVSSAIFRVSVIGKRFTGDKPPAVHERNPDALIRAFVWVLDQALSRPAEHIRQTIPPVSLRGAPDEDRAAREIVAELRRVGEFSGSPGRAVCGGLGDSAIFLAPSGELTIVGMNDGAPKSQSGGALKECTDVNGLQAHYSSGELIIAPARNADVIWAGPVGDHITKAALPLQAFCWAPVGARRIVAVDASGRLHSVRHESGKWSQVSFLPDFIEPSDRLVCGHVERTNEVVVLNGTKTEVVGLLPDGTFGERRKVALNPQYDTTTAAANRVGLFVAMMSSGDLIAASGAKTHSLGASRKETRVAFALAAGQRLVAKVGTDLRLVAVAMAGDSVRATDAGYTPPLQTDPDSIAWSGDGSLLFVTFADGTYAVFRPIGLTV